MRGRKRARRSTVRADSPDEDYPYFPSSPPPRPSRYQTRHSTTMLNHFPNLSTPLRNPIRLIIKNSSHSARLERENTVDDVKPAVSDGLPSCCGPTPTPANLGMEATSQAVDPQPSMDQCLFTSEDVNMSLSNGSPSCSGLIVSKPIQDSGNQEAEQAFAPLRENDVVLRAAQDKPRKSNTNFSHRSSRCLSAASSFNLTAYAQRLQEDMEEDPDEVESAIDPASACVEVYNVKSDSAPLLREILHRYGDIAGGTDIISPVIRSSLLQNVCDIYKRLKEAKFCSIPLRRLEEMRVEVQDLENLKIDVEWLRKKLDEIIQAHIEFGSYLTVKKDEKANVESLVRDEEDLKAFQDHLSLIQQKISAKKEHILEKKAKDDQLKRVALGIKARVTPLVKHGLFSQS